MAASTFSTHTFTRIPKSPALRKIIVADEGLFRSLVLARATQGPLVYAGAYGSNDIGGIGGIVAPGLARTRDSESSFARYRAVLSNWRLLVAGPAIGFQNAARSGLLVCVHRV